jgi:hypothetical protein
VDFRGQSRMSQEEADDSGQEEAPTRGSRGPYRASIIGFVAEYHAAAPLPPLTYAAMIPDSVLSYSSDASTHFDLVILRFGRSEESFRALAEAIRGSPGVSIQEFKVFKNGKNANRFYYLKTVVFPKKGSLYHHGVRRWSVTEAAKGFSGMYALLKCLEENDVTLARESKWSALRNRKATRLLSKYNLVFAP